MNFNKVNNAIFEVKNANNELIIIQMYCDKVEKKSQNYFFNIIFY